MRNGFKVWDTDTHVHPSVETLEQYLDASMKARLPELERFKVPGRTGGDVQAHPRPCGAASRSG